MVFAQDIMGKHQNQKQLKLIKGRKHNIKKENTTYFMTATVVEWLPIFKDPAIRQILIDALNYAIIERKLVVYGYCIMHNHIHIIANSEEPYLLKDIMRNFKRYTSRKIAVAMLAETDEWSQYCVSYFKAYGEFHCKAIAYKVWKDGNHAIELYSPAFYRQKLGYIHRNPVKAGFVERPEEWQCSSALDYAGGKSALVRVMQIPGI